jgi:nucleoside-diphosphate-sugar epimerase
MHGDAEHPERRLVAMSAAEAREHWRRHRRAVPRLPAELLAAFRGDRQLRDRLMATRELVTLREVASSLLPERWQQRIKSRMGTDKRPPAAGDAELPVLPLSPEMIDFFAARTRVRIDKARRLLGYEPAFPLQRGMELTREWARWANLLQQPPDG